MKSFALGAAMVLTVSAPALAAPTDPGCTAYDAQSDAILADINPAFALMKASDIATATKALPALEAHFAKVPAVRPAPQACGADVLVYDHHQYLSLVALKAAGKPTGFAKGANFVEKGLPFASLAYAVGWLKYEAQDFKGAEAAYRRGLLIAPNEHDLSTEVAMTLMNLEAWPELILFTDKFLAEDRDASPAVRAKMLAAKAYGLAITGNTDLARLTIAEALRLDPQNADAVTIDKEINPPATPG